MSCYFPAACNKKYCFSHNLSFSLCLIKTIQTHNSFVHRINVFLSINVLNTLSCTQFTTM